QTVDDAVALEFVEGSPHGLAVHLELLGEIALRRQPLVRREALLDHLHQMPANPLMLRQAIGCRHGLFLLWTNPILTTTRGVCQSHRATPGDWSTPITVILEDEWRFQCSGSRTAGAVRFSQAPWRW